jgi:hypothetical protein
VPAGTVDAQCRNGISGSPIRQTVTAAMTVPRERATERVNHLSRRDSMRSPAGRLTGRHDGAR